MWLSYRQNCTIWVTDKAIKIVVVFEKKDCIDPAIGKPPVIYADILDLILTKDGIIKIYALCVKLYIQWFMGCIVMDWMRGCKIMQYMAR